MALGWLWWRAGARLFAGDAAQFCVAGVAGVALGDIDLRFAWQVLPVLVSIKMSAVMPHVSAYLELSLCFVPVYIFLSSNELFVLCSHICK